MNIPSFSEFLASINSNSLNYDIDKFSDAELKAPTNTFTEEQYKMICKTNITMFFALLQQYHEWLEIQLQQ